MLLFSACGATGEDPDATSSPSATAQTEPSEPAEPDPTSGPDPDPDPTLTGKPGDQRRITGVVRRAPEERCTILSTGGTPAAWVLTGTVAGLEAGDRVTVIGRADPGATTRCQQGPVFVVAEVEPD